MGRRGVGDERRVVLYSRFTLVYCGGGIAATLAAFVLYQLGGKDISIYDASMSEWARDETLPIEKDVSS